MAGELGATVRHECLFEVCGEVEMVGSIEAAPDADKVSLFFESGHNSIDCASRSSESFHKPSEGRVAVERVDVPVAGEDKHEESFVARNKSVVSDRFVEQVIVNVGLRVSSWHSFVGSVLPYPSGGGARVRR